DRKARTDARDLIGHHPARAIEIVDRRLREDVVRLHRPRRAHRALAVAIDAAIEARTTELAAPHESPRLRVRGVVSALEADLQTDAGLSCRGDNAVSPFERGSDRLLHENVLPTPRRRHRVLFMEPPGRCDHDGAHVRSVEQRFDGLAARGSEVVRDTFSRGSVRVRHRDQLRAVDVPCHVLRVTPAHEAGADNTDAYGAQRRPSRPSISCIRTYPMTDSRNRRPTRRPSLMTGRSGSSVSAKRSS